MELRQYINILWKWMWLVVLSVVVAAVASFFASQATTPLYSTKTTLLVGSSLQKANPNSTEIYTGQQLAYTYIQLVKREPVLKGALDQLGIKMDWRALTNTISSNLIPNTQLIEISVVDSNPLRAKAVADAIAVQLILQTPSNGKNLDAVQAAFANEQATDLQTKIKSSQADIEKLQQQRDSAVSARQIQDLNNQITTLDSKISGWQSTYSQLLLSLNGGDTNMLTVVEQAAIPFYPISPNIPLNVATAAAIGLILSLGGAFLIEYLDDTVKTPDDIERIANLPTLGAITAIEGDEYGDKLITVKQPRSPITEAFRVLRTNIQYSSIDHPLRTIMMTSPGPGEGKSITLANLAVVTAQSGMRVILVDTDLRRPVQHKIFGISNRHGFSDAILHPNPGIEDHLQKTNVENLLVMTTGALPPNPAELLASDRMQDLIDELKKYADIVLFDSPPSLVVADAAILGSRVDGVIMVNDTGHTRTAESKRAIGELQRVRCNVLGAILNRISVTGDGYTYHYYYYYYSSDEGDKKKKSRRRLPGNWLTRQIPFLNRSSSKENKN